MDVEQREKGNLQRRSRDCFIGWRKVRRVQSEKKEKKRKRKKKRKEKKRKEKKRKEKNYNE